MTQKKRYTFDPEAGTFVEVQETRKDQLIRIGTILGLALVLAAAAAWVMDAHLIRTPQEQALRSENEVLQEQLSRVSEQMTALSTELTDLSERDRQLYRTLLQIEPISEDVRQVGVGGTDTYGAFDRFGDRTSKLLRQTSKTLDQLERQVSLQGASYRELARYAESRDQRLRELPAIRPTNGPIVSGYGMRHHPILKVRKMHGGVDFLVRTGTPVVSTGNGTIRRAGYSPTYGNYVDVRHKTAGYITRYAHLSEIQDGIRRGVTVERGQRLGKSGNTGRSTGPHLHYEVRDLQGRTLDPIDFFVPDMSPKNFYQLVERTEEYESRMMGASAEASKDDVANSGFTLNADG
jgi:murein DD-endopeptidase MepM/ murein hydrolase activator NlpD